MLREVNPQRILIQSRKIEDERIALKSFDEREFGQKITQVIVSNLAIEEVAKDFTKNPTALLKTFLPANLKLESLTGGKTKEASLEYITRLVFITLKDMSASKTFSERQKSIFGFCLELNQKEEFSKNMISCIRAHFDIEEPKPTSSPAP